jgi:hypothetical protein
MFNVVQLLLQDGNQDRGSFVFGDLLVALIRFEIKLGLDDLTQMRKFREDRFAFA